MKILDDNVIEVEANSEEYSLFNDAFESGKFLPGIYTYELFEFKVNIRVIYREYDSLLFYFDKNDNKKLLVKFGLKFTLNQISED